MHKPIRMITLLLIFTFRNPRDCIWIEDARRHRYRPYIHVRWRISLSMIVMAGFLCCQSCHLFMRGHCNCN